MSKKLTLEELLLTRLGITSQQLQDCVSEQKKTFASLISIITEKNLAAEKELLVALGEYFDIPFYAIKLEDIDTQLAKKIPSRLVTHYQFMPIKLAYNKVLIAFNDPFDILTIDEIALFLKQEVQISLALKKDILDSIKKFYGVGAETLEAMEGQIKNAPELPETSKDIQDETIDPSVIKFLNQVLLDAIKQQATDIHFEPFENDLNIRYRIDGILYEIPCPASIKHFQPQIASRIKVMASLDIAEKRRPQDGRVDVTLEGEQYDLRISIIPTPFGESIDIRILTRSRPLIGLEELGISQEKLEIIEKAIKKPHGIILVTGPTGSGKTTTLYACLNRINSSERKIITIEDPIEYQLKGVTQTQADLKTGFTFANALRSMLRHDPNVMMVGEIRDTETAELAVRTALTGHLVFSTLHTNDAAGGITRLLDMGIESFLASSSIILIIAQRLVRLICPHCKKEYTPSASLLERFAAFEKNTNAFFHGTGCQVCRFTGFKGRTGIFEILEVTDEIREYILQKTPSHQLKEKAMRSGMKTLKAMAWDKVTAGQTTVEEILRVIQEES